jgi:hypothetical protein
MFMSSGQVWYDGAVAIVSTVGCYQANGSHVSALSTNKKAQLTLVELRTVGDGLR